jgi:chemotaxis protein methyltransferase CheR
MTDLARPSPLGDHDFKTIVDIAARTAGLAIPETKKSLVQSRIARRMRQLGLSDYTDYLSSLETDTVEINHFISALTTNVSHFFREAHHFDDFAQTHLSHAAAGKLRFWSAGCSNGQEPYSMAMTVLRKLPQAAAQDVRILATDIDPAVIERAKQGAYSKQEIAGVPDGEQARFFERRADDMFEVKPELKSLISFRRLNLNAGKWPMSGHFDAIFCRNVMIYFNDDTQRALIEHFRARLRPGGSLYLGHSERVHPIEGSGFTITGVTTYRKS